MSTQCVRPCKSYSEEVVRAIATAYAKNYYLTFDDISTRLKRLNYNISPTMASNIVYRAIAECIVDDTIANIIYYKVIPNEEQKYYRNRRSSKTKLNHWEAAYTQREKLQDEIKNQIKEMETKLNESLIDSTAMEILYNEIESLKAKLY